MQNAIRKLMYADMMQAVRLQFSLLLHMVKMLILQICILKELHRSPKQILNMPVNWERPLNFLPRVCAGTVNIMRW